MTDSTTLVLGLGVAGQAVLEALVHRGVKALAVDDAPGDAAQRCAERLGVSLVKAPDPTDWPLLLEGVAEVAMGPGIPDSHPCHVAARVALSLIHI